MKRIPLRLTAFAGVIGLGAFLAWLGGYDFDTRNFWVAYWAANVIAIAALIAFGPFFIEDEQ